MQNVNALGGQVLPEGIPVNLKALHFGKLLFKVFQMRRNVLSLELALDRFERATIISAPGDDLSRPVLDTLSMRGSTGGYGGFPALGGGFFPVSSPTTATVSPTSLSPPVLSVLLGGDNLPSRPHLRRAGIGGAQAPEVHRNNGQYQGQGDKGDIAHVRGHFLPLGFAKKCFYFFLH